MGIPIARTVYEHLPVIDNLNETWEDQDLLIGSGRRPKKAKKKKKKRTNWSGLVRFITRPKSRTMRAKRNKRSRANRTNVPK